MADHPDDLAEVAHYEDLRSCANRAVWTIELQIRRLLAAPTDSNGVGEFALQPVSDAEFLILSLDRLLAVSRQINVMTDGAQSRAIAEYERSLPNLHTARNVVSHMDAYLHGDGRDQSIRVGALSTHLFDGDRLDFGGFAFNLGAALAVAEALLQSICSNPPESYRRTVAAAR